MNRLFGAKNTAPKPTLQGAITNLDTRIESIDVQLVKINSELQVYQKRICNKPDGPGKQALKQRALKVLQRRKMYETQKEQLEQQSWNMQQAGMMQDNLKSPSSSSTLPFPPLLSLLYICVLLPQLFPEKDFAVGAAVSMMLGVFGWLEVLLMLCRLFYCRRKNSVDVMVTVDAMKTTNKELKKQYGKVDISQIERIQDEMADLMDIGNDIQESISRSYDVPEEIGEAELDAELEALGDEIDLGGGWEAEGSSEIPSFLEEPTGIPEFLAETPTAATKVTEAV